MKKYILQYTKVSVSQIQLFAKRPFVGQQTSLLFMDLMLLSAGEHKKVSSQTSSSLAVQIILGMTWAWLVILRITLKSARWYDMHV